MINHGVAKNQMRTPDKRDSRAEVGVGQKCSCPLGSGAGTVLTAVLSTVLTAVLSAVVATTGIDELVDFGVAFVLGSLDHRDR